MKPTQLNGILNRYTLERFKQGDEKAFKQVFDHYYPGLLMFITKLTGNREEAEDIALRSFQSLYNRCHAFEAEINIKAFLYICGRNSGLNYIRAKQHEGAVMSKYAERMTDDTFLEFEFNIKQGVVAAIHKAIEELPVECQRVFKMLYIEELTPTEIAEILQITVSTVYNQKHRALTFLKGRFSENAIAVYCIMQMVAVLEDL